MRSQAPSFRHRVALQRLRVPERRSQVVAEPGDRSDVDRRVQHAVSEARCSGHNPAARGVLDGSGPGGRESESRSIHCRASSGWRERLHRNPCPLVQPIDRSVSSCCVVSMPSATVSSSRLWARGPLTTAGSRPPSCGARRPDPRPRRRPDDSAPRTALCRTIRTTGERLATGRHFRPTPPEQP